MSDQKNQYTEDNLFERLLLATAIMTYLLIVIGGIVRVTGSGLGCPDWPTCFGKWIPPMRADALIEYTHRLAATLTSPLILASAYFGWKKFANEKVISRPLLWVIVLLGFQGLLGGIVVLMETPPNLVAVHMGNALLILGLIILPYQAVIAIKNHSGVKLSFTTPFSKLTARTMAEIFVVLISGAIVVGSSSTYACAGWPLCNGKIIPSSFYGFVHMMHRALVLVTSISVIKLYLESIKGHPKLSKYALTATVLFFSQALIGALKVTLGFQVWLLGLHVAVAAAVWAAYVTLWAKASLAESE